jgi:GntR family transcriptional regulator
MGPGWVVVSIEATIISVMSSVKPDDGESVETNLTLARLDRSDPTLLHEQVAGEIRRAIARGEAGPGERIPQARDLAAELGVNTNTVLRALRVLRDEGLIEMGRGRSIRVTGTPQRGAVVSKMKELVDFARQQGYRRDELVAMLENLSR